MKSIEREWGAPVRGFSTLELMLVICIMGIMGAIAFTRVDLAKMEANSAVQILGTSMVAAQREAITKQHDLILTFDAAQRTVRMIWDRNSNGAIENGERVRVIPLDGRIGFGLGGASGPVVRIQCRSTSTATSAVVRR